jgi:integrase/recombinase XerD
MAIRVDASWEALVQSYRRYQLVERRLSPVTASNATFTVRRFLWWWCRKGGSDLAQLSAADLHHFVLDETSRVRVGAVRTEADVLRGFIRYLFVAGLIPRDLSGAVPKVAGSRFGGLPKAVERATLEALLNSCTPGLRSARRDYAILVLMSRLGLRAGEVARLVLEDLDWTAGTVRLRAKAGRLDYLPLPVDVGEAIVDYLRFARPPTTARAVFIQLVGPPVGMTRNAVTFVSRRASHRAGLDVVGAHRLRHTAATQMLRQGASLQEVGQVLRHSDDTTTAIYAKVDQAAMAAVVRPWPGSQR